MKIVLILATLVVVTLTRSEKRHSSHKPGKKYQCPDGSIIDETGNYCCPSDCGQCGGYGCHEFPGGEFNCCWSTFTNSCDDSAAPCVLSEDDDSSDPGDNGSCPYGSIIDETGRYCCPSDCGQCGGYGCHEFPGGEFNCCWSTFTNSCDDSAAPCVLSEEDDSSDSDDYSICPYGSIIDETEKYCCPEKCGLCGGYGCHEFPGGEFNCCGSNFINFCDESSAPCILIVDDDLSTSADETSCPDGSIIDDTGKYCCPNECGQCGGDGCHEFPGGEFNCCWSTFTNSCDDSGAPCVLSEDEPTQTSSCSQDGILAEVTLITNCVVSVCCPSSCEVCDTSAECTEPAECCAALIAAPVVISDVDVSCRDHDPPCVLPPDDDPCIDNPCQNGARCGYSWQGLLPYTDWACSETMSRFVCACDEIGNFIGDLCETDCGEDGTACGAQTATGWYTANNICCTAEEDCVGLSSKYNAITSCVTKDRPMSCDPNPCFYDVECFCNYSGYCSCVCPWGYEGMYCEVPPE